ncbi:8471_t:CDS:2 [Entrophospora sp. SA101]|nr:8471_t:CDS:2 [Entrophospora sp. SA101]
MNHLYNIIIIILASFSTLSHAHDHRDLSQVDIKLWTHIIFMFIAFALIFPIGMVLGLSKSKWHVPVQSLGTIIGTMGYFLGHSHGGKEFKIHSSFASIVVFLFLAQIGAGIYLKLHRIIIGKTHNLNNKHFARSIIQKIHSIIGITFPITSYIQIIFGIITLPGWCKDDHTGQCLAHFIMGSSFIGYGIIIIIMLKLGSEWLQKNNKSPEFYDTLGIIWWAGGLAGLYFTRNGKRNIFPALIIISTGFAMSAHQQSSEVSTVIHATFGFTLVSAGLARIIEICFFENIYKNKKSLNNPFLILPPYVKLNELEILSSSSYRITPNSNNDLRKDDGNGDDVEKISFEVDNLLPDKNRYS